VSLARRNGEEGRQDKRENDEDHDRDQEDEQY
jgi:hypothetical protein